MDSELARHQLDRMLNSTAFAGADRRSRLLRFVIERTLAGGAQEIKESVICVEVLGPNPSSDPKIDPVHGEFVERLTNAEAHEWPKLHGRGRVPHR
jgi:hypothetical protein